MWIFRTNRLTRLIWKFILLESINLLSNYMCIVARMVCQQGYSSRCTLRTELTLPFDHYEVLLQLLFGKAIHNCVKITNKAVFIGRTSYKGWCMWRLVAEKNIIQWISVYFVILLVMVLEIAVWNFLVVFSPAGWVFVLHSTSPADSHLSFLRLVVI